MPFFNIYSRYSGAPKSSEADLLEEHVPDEDTLRMMDEDELASYNRDYGDDCMEFLLDQHRMSQPDADVWAERE